MYQAATNTNSSQAGYSNIDESRASNISKSKRSARASVTSKRGKRHGVDDDIGLPNLNIAMQEAHPVNIIINNDGLLLQSQPTPIGENKLVKKGLGRSSVKVMDRKDSN